MEGLFFYVGFTQILALGRQNKMTGAAEQYQYILRDESMHCNFLASTSSTSSSENPPVDCRFKEEIKGLVHEGRQAGIPIRRRHHARGVLGMNASMFKGYLRYIANRRATPDRPGNPLPQQREPLPMDEQDDRPEEGT